MTRITYFLQFDSLFVRRGTWSSYRINYVQFFYKKKIYSIKILLNAQTLIRIITFSKAWGGLQYLKTKKKPSILPISLEWPPYCCYGPAYSKNSGRALSVTPVHPVRQSVRPSICPSVRPYVPLSCPGHNSKTLWNIFMKLHRCIHHNKTMCHEQGRQRSHFWFLNYFPLT